MDDETTKWLDRYAPEMGGYWKRSLILGHEELSNLSGFIDAAYRDANVCPCKRSDLFKAFELTDLNKTKAVILGHDPYPDQAKACGLAFSYPSNTDAKLTGSMKNILTVLEDDLKIRATSSDFSPWAREGVLLLNAALTYQGKDMQRKSRRAWKPFLEAVLRALSESGNKIVFLAWGGDAHKALKDIESDKCHVIYSSHPDPRSWEKCCNGHKPFKGSRPFSEANEWLSENARGEILWSAIETSSSDDERI